MSAMDEYALFTTASGDEILEEEEYEKLYSAPTEIVALLSVFYGGISIIAIVGNTLVIWVVATTRQMRTVTNMYIANLAFADVIIGMFCIPFQFHAALLQRWTLPDFMCAFCPFVQAVSVNVSVFTLTAIAIDRHRAIINPLRARPTKFISKIIIATIWVTAITFAVPCAVAFRVEELHERIRENDIIFNISRPFCANINLSDDQLRTYRYSLVFMQYLVPFCVVSFVYIQMAVKLWGTKAPGNAQDSRDITLLRNKKKVIKMLIIVVVVFGICWLPLQSYNILYVTIPEINEYRFINIIWFCCDWLAMSNSCYNPFIYGIYNEKFKREFNKRFSVCFCKFHTSFDNQDRTISIHTRASSVRSTYGTASTRIRNNIFGPHASHYGHTSFHQHPNSAISSRSASMKNARNHGKVDYNVVFSGEMKKLHINPKANGIKFDSSSPIVSSQKDDWQHLPEDGIKTVGITKAAMIAESTHSMPDDTIFNARNVLFTSSSCVCEDALGSRTLCDGSCILNEVARVKCGIEMYGDTKNQDTSLDVCLELSECSPLHPREIRPVI